MITYEQIKVKKPNIKDHSVHNSCTGWVGVYKEARLTYVRKHNLGRSVSQGMFSMVYNHPTRKRRIVKIGYIKSGVRGSNAYLEYAKEILSYQGNPFFPKIYSLKIIQGHVSRDCPDYVEDLLYVVEMERLRHNTLLRDDDNDFLFKSYAQTVGAVNRQVEVLRKKFQSIGVDIPSERIDHLKQVYMVLGKMSAHHYFDMHDHNVMYRGKQVVITDPVS